METQVIDAETDLVRYTKSWLAGRQNDDVLVIAKTPYGKCLEALQALSSAGIYDQEAYCSTVMMGRDKIAFTTVSRRINVEVLRQLIDQINTEGHPLLKHLSVHHGPDSIIRIGP